jgi:hypothetical protein
MAAFYGSTPILTFSLQGEGTLSLGVPQRAILSATASATSIPSIAADMMPPA